MPRGTYSPIVVVDTSNLTEEEWLDYRRGGIGGSDVSIIFGVSHFRTGREHYYDKLSIQPYVTEEDTTWLQKKMGHVLEELVAEVFRKKTGLEVYEVKKMFSHPMYPFMRADVDRFVKTKDGKRGILECKTTNWQNRDAWEDEKYPYQYELQIRHYMAVMNLDFAYIACLWGNNENDFAYRYVERDYDFEDEIIETEQHFWEEYVQKRVEPPFVEKPDMIMECLKKYVETANPTLPKMALSKTYEADVAKIVALKEKKSELDAELRKVDSEIKQLSAPIIEEMGPVCECELTVPGKRFYITYKTQTRTNINADRLKKMAIHHKSVYDEYVSQSVSRSLKVKEMKVS